MMRPAVRILDSTLREGEQTPGVAFPVHVKAAIARMLDKIGVDFIEAGHPAVSNEVREAVFHISSLHLNAMVAAHGRTLREDMDLALEAGAKFIGIFFCVTQKRLVHHRLSLSEAIRRVVETISYVKSKAPYVIVRYTPEDTVRSKWSNVVTAAAEAVRAGADIISVADTTGFMIPGTERSMYDFISRLREEFARQDLWPAIAVHCHNDRGLALANALDGYRAGATIIDASVLGLGERAGIVDLASLLSILSLDFGHVGKWNLKSLYSLYRLVSRFTNIEIPCNFPLMGRNAFTHCAGVHTQAVINDPFHYQSILPESVGRRHGIALDHMSGIASVKYALEKIGCRTDNTFAKEVLHFVKETGHKGRSVNLEELRLIVRYLEEKHVERGAVV